MSSLAQRSEALTPEDEAIMYWHVDHQSVYEYSIADRNDFAIMKARTVLALTGCKATRDRVMPI